MASKWTVESQERNANGVTRYYMTKGGGEQTCYYMDVSDNAETVDCTFKAGSPPYRAIRKTIDQHNVNAYLARCEANDSGPVVAHSQRARLENREAVHTDIAAPFEHQVIAQCAGGPDNLGAMFITLYDTHKGLYVVYRVDVHGMCHGGQYGLPSSKAAIMAMLERAGYGND